MKHAVPHDLGQELAKKVADSAFASYAQKFGKYDPKSVWVSPTRANISFSVKGMTLKGTLEVSSTTIEMDLDVPFLLRPFKGTAISVIEGEIKHWITKAKAGEIS
jgi:putative polyhydroxyalkanoic acid system protein